MAQRPFSAKKSNDHDYVLPEAKIRRKKGDDLSKYDPLLEIPEFHPISIPYRAGSPNLPPELDASDPYALFRYVFNDEVINHIVFCTNKYAESDREENTASRARNTTAQAKEDYSFKAKSWRPVSNGEILAYIGIDLYMGLNPAPQLHDFWARWPENGAEKPTFSKPVHPDVYEAMGRDRWDQINRYLHVHDPDSGQSEGLKKPRAHEKVNFISETLRSAFQRLWALGSDIAIDECIEAFTGRSSETVIIPSKPTPEGYKIWVLAEKGYVFNWRFHVVGSKKHQGPQGIDPKWLKCGFCPTRGVVIDLLMDLPYKSTQFCVWLDNLFTSPKLLAFLRHHGIGAAGTLRLSTTAREDGIKKANNRKRDHDDRDHQPTTTDEGIDQSERENAATQASIDGQDSQDTQKDTQATLVETQSFEGMIDATITALQVEDASFFNTNIRDSDIGTKTL
jgi:Transposase IS4